MRSMIGTDYYIELLPDYAECGACNGICKSDHHRLSLCGSDGIA